MIDARAGDAHAQAIVQHLRRHLGEPTTVLQETDPAALRIDVLVFPPADDRPFVTLATVGMSAEPMRVPAGAEDLARLELLLGVPSDWPGLTGGIADVDGALRHDAAYWPIRLLKALARYPHRSGAWLSLGHTLPSAARLHEAIASSTVLVAPPLGLPAAIVDAATPSGPVSVLAVVPLLDAEADAAAAGEDGVREVVARLEVAGVTVAIDVGRPSVV